MTLLKSMVAVPLALVLVVGALGCGSPADQSTAQTTAPVNDLDAEGIIAKTISAHNNVETLQMDMSMSMDMSTTGAEQPMDVTMKMDADGSMDMPSRKMYLAMDIDMEVPFVGQQQVSSDMYMMDGWMYMKVKTAVAPDEWMKVKLDDQLWDQQNQLAQQIDVLKGAVELSSLGSESVNGIDCYVISVKPNMSSISELVGSQLPDNSGTEFMEKIDFDKVIKNLSIKQWISKTDFLPVKSETSMVFEMTAEDVGSASDAFDKMSMTMATVVTYSGYNDPITITLPSEAATAQDKTGS